MPHGPGHRGTDDPLALNRAQWDERVPIHLASEFYDVDGFRAGRSSLQPFELDEVGDVTGLDLVHLQCHFGMDTLSWARRGARVAGVDFSGPAVEAARGLAAELGLDATFVQADVYDAAEELSRTFDVVYTGHGALNWLPDLDRWARLVATLLRPGGFCYLSEFHPVGWAFAEAEPRLAGDCFDRGPLRVEEPGTYADVEATTEHNVTYEWNHPLGEVVGALLGASLQLELLRERPYTLFGQFQWLEQREDGRYWPPAGCGIPLMYSLRARKPGAPGATGS